MPITKEQIAAMTENLLHALPEIVFIAAGTLAVSMIFGRLMNLVADKTSLTRKEIEPARSLVTWIVYLAGLVFIMQALGLNISGMWAVLSAVFAMIAVGFFAVWSVLSNTLCTLMILVFRPFAVDDEIEFPGEQVKGRVVDLNFIYTTLEVEPGVVMQIPNNLFFQKTIKRRHSVAPVSLASQLRSKPQPISRAEAQAALRKAIAAPAGQTQSS